MSIIVNKLTAVYNYPKETYGTHTNTKNASMCTDMLNQYIVLQDISFELKRGEILSIIGPCGSGKTTLARHINALYTPYCGEVTVDGADSADKKQQRNIMRKVGLVSQNPDEQIFSETIFDEIAYAPRNWGIDEKEIPQKVKKAIADTGLFGIATEKSPYTLSGGQKKLLTIASVISADPSYLILDEPAACLDAVSAENINKMIQNLAEKGLGIILITHDIETALKLSDKILILENGRQKYFGEPHKTGIHKILSLLPDIPEIVKISLKLEQKGIITAPAWSAEMLIQQIKAYLYPKNGHMRQQDKHACPNTYTYSK